MAAKLIICVNAQGAVAAEYKAGRLGSAFVFPAGDSGLAALGELLGEHPEAPVHVMVDTVEEDYHTETLPHAVGHARQEMLRRRLRQTYRNTIYCAACLQGKETGKRRDDRYLFAALTNADLLRPWLEVIRGRNAPLAGIYLLPQVSEVLLGRLKIARDNLLMVARHRGGLRLSFFQSGRLRASRLAIADDEASTAAHFAAEVGKTRLYLASLRLLQREGKLTVLLLENAFQMAELLEHLAKDSTMECHRMVRKDVESLLAGTVAEGYPYALHMLALGMFPPGCNLAPESTTHGYWHYRQRRNLLAASAMVLAVAAGWTGVNLFRQYELGKEIARAQHLASLERGRYQEVAKTFPAAPASAEKLEETVHVAKQIEAHRLLPSAFMAAISRGLAGSPNVFVLGLDWRFSPDEESGEQAVANGGRGPLWREWGLVSGEIRPFQGDYREAMADVERFAETLRKDRAISSVSVVKMPLNIQSSLPLSGNTLDAIGAAAARAEFKLKVVLKEKAS